MIWIRTAVMFMYPKDRAQMGRVPGGAQMNMQALTMTGET